MTDQDFIDAAAIAAMQGLTDYYGGIVNPEETAREAYTMAFALLAERKRRMVEPPKAS